MEACEGHVGELKNKAEKGESQESGPGDSDEVEYYDDEEDGEIAYSQGYDWIQGSVMYEAEDGDYEGDYAFDGEDDDMGDFDDYDDDYDDDYGYEDDYDFEPDSGQTIPQKQTLKSLKQKAREMERRGEFGEF